MACDDGRPSTYILTSSRLLAAAFFSSSLPSVIQFISIEVRIMLFGALPRVVVARLPSRLFGEMADGKVILVLLSIWFIIRSSDVRSYYGCSLLSSVEPPLFRRLV